MTVSQKDKDVLRGLADQQARIAALPVHQEKAELWRRLNGLEPTRPLIWVYDGNTPWHKMNVDDELTLQTTDAWAREVETGLRRALYQWKHMPGDMVVNDYLSSPLVIHSTGYGLTEDVDIVRTDEASDIVSVIDRVYPLSEVAEAMRYLEEGHARGKVVISLERNSGA